MNQQRLAQLRSNVPARTSIIIELTSDHDSEWALALEGNRFITDIKISIKGIQEGKTQSQILA